MQQSFVIVRAFQGEPLKRVVVDRTDTRASVALPEMLERIAAGETNAVSLPRSDIYQFDGPIYDRLKAEWTSKKATNPQTWRALKAWAG